MSWVVLIASGLLEAVWATALSRSKGFRKLRPTIVFVVAAVGSIAGLAFAMTSIAVGTAYAVWVGVGAVTTAVWALVTRAERASIVRILLIALLVSSIVGLKVVH